MSEWTKVESGSSLGIPLPQFSAYPLHYVSAFGEYIMLVPQQLEGLVSTDTETDNQILDQEEQMASTLLTKAHLIRSIVSTFCVLGDYWMRRVVCRRDLEFETHFFLRRRAVDVRSSVLFKRPLCHGFHNSCFADLRHRIHPIPNRNTQATHRSRTTRQQQTLRPLQDS